MEVAFGLISAFAWGAADFTGGLASRKTGAYRTVLFGEAIGLPLILAFALISSQPIPALSTWLLALTAGSLGTSGLLLLYHSMTRGLMSIATPVSALLAALLPVVLGSILEVPAGPLAVLGFVFALAAVWLISQSGDGVKNILVHLSDIRLPLLSGVGFGLYFVLMHAATRNATLWPMAASRMGGILILSLYMILSRQPWFPNRGSFTMIVLNGLLDISGNLFFVLAGQIGRLDVASVLSSLYPGSTLILASLFLHERLSRIQWIGIACAFVAIILFTV